eukprot:IDg18379t1
MTGGELDGVTAACNEPRDAYHTAITSVPPLQRTHLRQHRQPCTGALARRPAQRFPTQIETAVALRTAPHCTAPRARGMITHAWTRACCAPDRNVPGHVARAAPRARDAAQNYFRV